MTDTDDADDIGEQVDVNTGPIPADEKDAQKANGESYQTREDFEKNAVMQLQSAIDDIEDPDEDITVVGVSVEVCAVVDSDLSEASQNAVKYTNARALDPEVPVQLTPAVFRQTNAALIENAYDVGLRDAIEDSGQPTVLEGPDIGDLLGQIM